MNKKDIKIMELESINLFLRSTVLMLEFKVGILEHSLNLKDALGEIDKGLVSVYEGSK